MGWETRRNGKQYFYHKCRIGDRVVSLYVGTGANASEFERELRKRLEDRQRLLVAKERMSQLLGSLASLDEVANQLIELESQAAGLYRHHGTWRKRRGR